MKILVAGATGFVGKNLIPALLAKGYEVVVMGRSVEKITQTFGATVVGLDWHQLSTIFPDDFSAVINLAGENIAQSRWTERVKKLIIESRVLTTKKLVHWCLSAKLKKPHFYSASAIGIYGLQKSSHALSEPLTETTEIAVNPQYFVNQVGKVWEEAAKPLVDAYFPVTWMRFAVVLKQDEGILKKLKPTFQLGLGSILGTGQQPFSWIHIDDLVAAILFLLSHPEITGAVNLSAPECVSQKTFAEQLAKAMHKPLFLTMPVGLIKILFGPMGEELLLNGQNVYPARLLQSGFNFSYPRLELALKHEWKY